jgi:hypothetical protein
MRKVAVDADGVGGVGAFPQPSAWLQRVLASVRQMAIEPGSTPPPYASLKAARINHLAALFLCNLQKPQTCWSDVCVVCTDHAAGSSSWSASATAAVACTLPGE